MSPPARMATSGAGSAHRTESGKESRRLSDRERIRVRDFYEEVMAYTQAERERSLKGRVVVRARDLPWVQERQGFVKYYLWPSRYSGRPPETALDDWAVFAQRIRTHSGKHRHQGGLVIFVLEGEGYSVIDGVRYDWEAGDLLMLPHKPGGVEHQHFNRQEGTSAKWVAFIHAALYDWGASELVQLRDHPDFHGEGFTSQRPPMSERAEAAEPVGPPREHAARAGEGSSGVAPRLMALGTRDQSVPREENLLEWLYALRDAQRAEGERALCVARGRELPWEDNSQGRMKWYLHPAMQGTAIRALIVYVQEIPAGGRTGVQRVPGGSVLFMLQGSGYTWLDGERHDWQAGDCLNLPIRRDGVAVQHVNLAPAQPAAFVSVDLNLVDVLGVDRGAVFEQLQPAVEPAGG